MDRRGEERGEWWCVDSLVMHILESVRVSGCPRRRGTLRPVALYIERMLGVSVGYI